MRRVYNFNPGPATLPLEVMQQAQAEFVDYRQAGYGLMEASHRSPQFAAVIDGAEANLRTLLGIPEDYAVLFLQGGASTQFAMAPMNLLDPGQTAEYVDTGSWSTKAIKEAAKLGQVRVVASGKDTTYTAIPDPAALQLAPDAAYLHITSNNTIAGTQYHRFPEPPAGVPLLADASSDICSRPLDVSRFGLIYAGAQKNLGPSGVTMVIIRRDLAERAPEQLPTMLQYRTHISKGSLFNTPPTFAIYMLKLVTDWLLTKGGVAGIEAQNRSKAGELYGTIDADEFYRCPAAPESRSLMNVCFRLPGEDLEKQFLEEATAAGMIGLKGHRSVGGLRASIYNAMPPAGVTCLCQFMDEFRRQHG